MIADATRPPSYADRRRAFVGGFADAARLPGPVVGAGMVGFGSLAHESGLDAWLAISATGAVWSLPGQVALAELHALGASALVIVIAVCVANVRFLPMSLSLMPVLRTAPGGRAWHYLAAHLVSVNIWAGCMRRCPELPGDHRPPYYFGYSVVCMGAGLAGTAIGFALAGVLPWVVTLGLVFLNPLYLSLVFVEVRHRAQVLALLLGAAMGPAVHLVSPDWGMIATGVLAGSIAFGADAAWSRRRG